MFAEEDGEEFFNVLLREARIRADLSQIMAAAIVDMDGSTLCGWERGVRLPAPGPASRDRVRRLGEALGVDLLPSLDYSRKWARPRLGYCMYGHRTDVSPCHECARQWKKIGIEQRSRRRAEARLAAGHTEECDIRCRKSHKPNLSATPEAWAVYRRREQEKKRAANAERRQAAGHTDACTPKCIIVHDGPARLCRNKEHPMEGDNVVVLANGIRRCRECWRARDREYAARKPTCRRGHRLTDDNMYLTPTGQRRCVTCRLMAAIAKREYWSTRATRSAGTA